MRAILIALMLGVATTAHAMTVVAPCDPVEQSVFLDRLEAAGFSRVAFSRLMEEAGYAEDFSTATAFCVRWDEGFRGEAQSQAWEYFMYASTDEEALSSYRLIFKTAPPLGRDGDVVFLVRRREK